MPARYSGNVTVRLEYRDPKQGDDRQHGHYQCWVSWPGGRNIVFVEPPAHLTVAVDSPRAFDDAAHAAMSFTEHDGSSQDGSFEPDYSDSGYVILRKKR